jgi:hypothetical protein
MFTCCIKHARPLKAHLMYVSTETPSQTVHRLREVIRTAELVRYEAHYVFAEFDANQFPVHLIKTALAFVRDEDVWSALVPGGDTNAEQFVLFSFHFKPGLDNSGFVGWLASHIKSTLGSGVFVVCGQNTARGGVFDYWGAPVAVAEAVLLEVNNLRLEV